MKKWKYQDLETRVDIQIMYLVQVVIGTLESEEN